MKGTDTDLLLMFRLKPSELNAAITIKLFLNYRISRLYYYNGPLRIRPKIRILDPKRVCVPTYLHAVRYLPVGIYYPVLWIRIQIRIRI